MMDRGTCRICLQTSHQTSSTSPVRETFYLHCYFNPELKYEHNMDPDRLMKDLTEIKGLIKCPVLTE